MVDLAEIMVTFGPIFLACSCRIIEITLYKIISRAAKVANTVIQCIQEKENRVVVTFLNKCIVPVII